MRSIRLVKLGRRVVGPGYPALIIAEAGVNHGGDLSMARRLVAAAAAAGADAVKFQTFRSESVVSRGASKAAYQMETTQSDQSQLEMLKDLELLPEAHEELQVLCSELELMFVSTPFDERSVDLLDCLGVPFMKIGSGEITNLPFLAYAASKKRAIVLSTGMSTLLEVEEAVGVLERAGCEELVLLHCVSNYPADPADANLKAMQTMAEGCGYPVGYSDHTLGIEVALAAAALGAAIIEKHFTLDRALPGPDHRASLEPDEFRRMVSGIRTVERALGTGLKAPAAAEIDTARAARRSLVAARDIDPGEKLQEADVAILRPGSGLPPSMLPYVLGRLAKVRIPSGTVLDLEMLS